MMKKQCKTAALCLSAAFAATAIGGTAAMFTKKEVHADAPVTFNEFLVGCWESFIPTDVISYEDQLEDLARSGQNWVLNPLKKSSTNSDKGQHMSLTEINPMYEKYNMKFIAQPNTNSPQTVTQADVQAIVDEVKSGNLSACIGYYVKDEPSAAQFAATVKVYNEFYKQDNTRFPLVNLFPNYAGASNLGGSYEDYVQNWVDTVGAENMEYLPYDHYPFSEFEDVRASFFSDMETIRKVAYNNGKIKTIGMPQLGSWNGMRRPTPTEAKWNSNAYLAYGFKGISHFVWSTPAYVSPEDGGEGMRDFVIRRDGSKTDLYEPMQKVNWQMRQLGQELMKLDVAHAYHAGKVAQGAEELPKSFVFQPTSSDDNLILSLGYGKNGEDIYVIVFANELSGEKKRYTLNVDTSAGVESLTRYVVDSFDTLPDYMQELPAPQQETVNVSSGSFSVELGPGDIMLYKLNGSVTIKEPLQTPTINCKSGTYLGPQEIVLNSFDKGAEIYYTTDGSYPTYRSARYTGPFTVGKNGEFGFETVRAIAIRGDEISDAVTSELIISDGSRNMALGKPVSFVNFDGLPAQTSLLQGDTDDRSLTDGRFDPFNTLGSVSGKPCFAVVDLGDTYKIDKLVVKAWHDWTFKDVVLQVSETEDFENAVTIFNNDTDNSVGCGEGSDGTYKENPNSGHTFRFAPATVRYVRFTNCSDNDTQMSLWEEIQAYSYYNGGENILLETENWKATGGGVWVRNEDGSVTQTLPHDHDSWDRSYTYTARTFKNFILEGTFKMEQITDPASWGYVGFGMYKPEIEDVQSNTDHGYYAAVEPRGRALLWNGAKPELGPEDANIVRFSLAGEFTLRVISLDDMISVSVNGAPAIFMRGEIFDRDAGYISIHGGLVPVTVSSVTICDIPEGQKPLVLEECLKSAESIRLSVPRFTKKTDVLKQLPKTLDAKDVSGNSYTLPVTWKCGNYDPSVTGWTTFTASFTELPENVVDLYGVTGTADVFIRPNVDKSRLEGYVALARSLKEEYFTPESWANMIIKLEAAEALLADEYLVQNDIGVGEFQLYDQIYRYLESVIDRSALQTSLEAAREALEGAPSENARKILQNAISAAEKVYEYNLSTPGDITAAVNALRATVSGLESKAEVQSPAEKPDLSPAPSDETPEKGCGAVTAVPAMAGLGLAAATLLKRKRRKK